MNIFLMAYVFGLIAIGIVAHYIATRNDGDEDYGPMALIVYAIAGAIGAFIGALVWWVIHS